MVAFEGAAIRSELHQVRNWRRWGVEVPLRGHFNVFLLCWGLLFEEIWRRSEVANRKTHWTNEFTEDHFLCFLKLFTSSSSWCSRWVPDTWLLFMAAHNNQSSYTLQPWCYQTSIEWRIFQLKIWSWNLFPKPETSSLFQRFFENVSCMHCYFYKITFILFFIMDCISAFFGNCFFFRCYLLLNVVVYLYSFICAFLIWSETK